MEGKDMTSTQPVWISPHAYERLQRELATLRELCTATAAAVIATETVPLSNAGAGTDSTNT
jgi:hypothetical protein